MRIFLPASIFVLSACGSEEGVKVHNSDPSVTITSHVDGDTVFASEVASFRATVSDDDHSAPELSVQWSFGNRVACPFTPPDADGGSTCEATIEAGEDTVTVEVRDPKSATGTDTVTLSVIVSDAPTAQITSPQASVTYYSDQLIPFTAIIDDAEDEPTDLTYQWESSLDGPLSITGQPESSGEIEGFLTLSEGQHAISLTVEDTSGKTTTESVVIEVGGENNEPLCEITAPESDSSYVLGQDIRFSGTATDEDINNNQLSITWESDQDGVFNSTAANSAGELELLYGGLSKGNHIITLKVADDAEGSCSDTVLVAIGTPPTLTVLTPTSGDVVSLGDSVSFTATVSDEEDIPSDITMSFVSDIDGEFSTQGADSSGNIAFGINSLSAGEHNVMITATDTDSLTASTAMTIRVNTPPPAPQVSLSPDPVYSTDDLTANVVGGNDEDGDTVNFEYEWFENGVLTAATTSMVLATELDVGDVWKVRVTPNDGYVDGDYTEATITVSNTEPAVSNVSISPNTGVFNDTVLTCSATATDADETVTPTFEWTVGNTTHSGPTLDLSTTTAMPTDVVTCTATVTDSNGGTVSANTTVTVENRSPTVGNVFISPTTVYTNSLVSCTANLADDDGETPSYSVEWSVGGVSIATGDSFQLDSSLVSVGDSLVCTITATDGYSGTASDSASVSIANTNPVVDTITLTPIEPNKHDTLSCSAVASDIDGETPTLGFSWSNLTTGDTYSSTTNSVDTATLDLSLLSVSPDDVVECSVSATDADSGSTTEVETVSIINSTPVFDTNATITPSSGIYTTTSLTCSATVTDPDDGSLTPSFEWTVNGISIETGSTYTVLAADTDVGDDIVCTATATDSDGESISSSATVTVENTPPVLGSSALNPNTGVTTASSLTCSASASDVDEDTVTISYNWSNTTSGSTLGSGATLTLSPATAQPGNEIECSILADDGKGGTDSATQMVTVENTNPVLTDVTISPDPAYNDDSFSCTVTASDADNESLTTTYTWANSTTGTVLGNAATLTLSSADASPSHTIVCDASVDDGSGGNDSGSSSITLGNRG